MEFSQYGLNRPFQSKNGQYKKQNLRDEDVNYIPHHDYQNSRNERNYKSNEERKILNIWKARKTIIDSKKNDCILPLSIMITIWICCFFWTVSNTYSIVIFFISTIVSVLIYYVTYKPEPEIELNHSKKKGLNETKVNKNNSYFFFNHNYNELFIRNRGNRTIYGIKTYKITIVPSTVQCNFDAFLRNLYQKGIEFTYQFSYKPDLDFSDFKKKNPETLISTILRELSGKNSNIYHNKQLQKLKNATTKNSKNLSDTFKIEINFNFYTKERYSLNISNSIDVIYDRLASIDVFIRTLFKQNFTHYKIEPVKGKEYIYNIQSKFKEEVPIISSKKFPKTIKQINENQNFRNINLTPCFSILLKKCIFYLLNLAIMDVILLGIISKSQKVLIWLNIISLIIIIWPLISEYVVFRQFIADEDTFEYFNPFYSVKWFHSNEHPGIHFGLLINQKIIFAIRSVVLSSLPTYYSCDSAKFLRSLTAEGEKSSIFHTINIQPYGMKDFINQHFDGLSEYVKRILVKPEGIKIKLDSSVKYDQKLIDQNIFQKWIAQRAGIFNTSQVFEVFSFLRIDSLDDSNFSELMHKLDICYQNLITAVETSFFGAKLEESSTPIISNKLFLHTSLKIGDFFTRGTGIKKIPIQTKNLPYLYILSGEVKKGIKSRIPVEFNTPTSHMADIDFAYIFNTQTNSTEAKTGINFEQIIDSNIAIIGDNEDLNSLWSLAIINRALRKGLNSIIFDTTGKFNSLYSINKKACNLRKLNFLKIGKTFSIDLFKCENKGDSYQTEYIDNLANIFKLAYNLSDSRGGVIDKILKDTRFDEIGKKEINITYIKNRISNYTTNFSRDNLELVNLILNNLDNSKNLKFFGIQQNSSIFRKVVTDDKTTIFDLSELNREEQILAELVLIAKITSLTKEFHENQEKFFQKLILIKEPTELLNRRVQTSRLEPFEILKDLIKPLKSNNFGFILECSNISILGSEISSICSNFIASRTLKIRSKMILTELLQLNDSPEDSASSRRKNKYQRDFLEKLPDNIAVFKPNNSDTPFAIEIDQNNLKNIKLPSQKQIQDYMRKIGYDLKGIKKDLEKFSKKTDLEKDFELFMQHLPSIMQFLAQMSVPTPSGLTLAKCKEILKEIVEESLKKTYKSSSEIRQARNDIMDTVIKHNYVNEQFNNNYPGASNAIRLYTPTQKIKRAIKEYHSKFNLELKFELYDINSEDDEIDSNIENTDEQDFKPEILIEKTSSFSKFNSNSQNIMIESEKMKADKELVNNSLSIEEMDTDTDSFKVSSTENNTEVLEHSKFFENLLDEVLEYGVVDQPNSEENYDSEEIM